MCPPHPTTVRFYFNRRHHAALPRTAAAGQRLNHCNAAIFHSSVPPASLTTSSAHAGSAIGNGNSERFNHYTIMGKRGPLGAPSDRCRSPRLTSGIHYFHGDQNETKANRRGQGAGVEEIAMALKIGRASVYRVLNTA
jgi:hypothetical protein